MEIKTVEIHRYGRHSIWDEIYVSFYMYRHKPFVTKYDRRRWVTETEEKRRPFFAIMEYTDLLWYGEGVFFRGSFWEYTVGMWQGPNASEKIFDSLEYLLLQITT